MNSKAWMAQKLRGIILLQLGRIAFRFHSGERKPSIVILVGFPWLRQPIILNFGDTRILQIIPEETKYIYENCNVGHLEIPGIYLREVVEKTAAEKF